MELIRTESADLFAPAVLQAFAAVVIMGLTAWLASSTNRYVKEMQRSNALQAEANRVATTALALALGEARPRLVVSSGGRTEEGDEIRADIYVHNAGGGPAHSIQIHTDWGMTTLAFLAAGHKAEPMPSVTKAIPPGEKINYDPRIERVDYRDAAGNQFSEDPVGPGQGN